MIALYIINPLTLLLVYVAWAHVNGVVLKALTIVGGLLDFAVNVTWFTIIFIEIPKEYLLTKRVERLKSTSGYRGWLANTICKLLNYIKAGHCS
jgi:hypothetical protein